MKKFLSISFLSGAFLNGIQSTFAQSDTSGTSTSSILGGPIYFLLIIGWLCYSQRRKAIGGWLLFFYIQFIGLASFFLFMGLKGIETGEYIFSIPILIISVTEIIFGILSLLKPFNYIVGLIFGFASTSFSKGFRNRRTYNAFRIISLINFIGLLIIGAIDIYQGGNVIGNLLRTIGPIFGLLYLTYSKRAKIVLIEDKRDPNTFYPSKKNKFIDPASGICPKCDHNNGKNTYSCKKCGEVFRKSKEQYNQYMTNIGKIKKLKGE